MFVFSQNVFERRCHKNDQVSRRKKIYHSSKELLFVISNFLSYSEA